MHSQWWKSESFPHKIRNREKISALVTSIQYYTGPYSQSNWGKKEIINHIGKKEVKLALFSDGMILYRENLPTPTTKND